MQSATPLLPVQEMEKNLVFWNQLGFQTTMHVPEQAPYDFAIVQAGQAQIMLQTHESIQEDLGVSSQGNALVYVKTDNLEQLEKRAKPDWIAVSKRTTFYGATEIFLRDPEGHVIGFAEFPKE